MPYSRLWVLVVGAVLVAFAAIGLAACGGSSSDSTANATTESSGGDGGASSGEEGGATEAQALLKDAMEVPDTIAIEEPLSKMPPSGKRIIFMECELAVCKGFKQGLGPAADALGWTMEYQPYGVAPESQQSSLETAIRKKPDGIFMTGITRSIVKEQVEMAKKQGIPIVTGYDPDPVEPGIVANIADAKGASGNSARAAAYVAAESDGEGKAGVFTTPAYPIVTASTDALMKELGAICPKCSAEEKLVEPSAIGTTLPQEAVSLMQQDPDIEYLLFGFGDMATGVVPALKAAGIENVSVLAFGAASPPNLAFVANGEEAAETGYGIPYGAWRAMDAFARYFVGDDTSIDTTAENPGQLFTKENVPTEENWFFAMDPEYQKKFEELWGV